MDTYKMLPVIWGLLLVTPAMSVTPQTPVKFDPKWDSLDSRPLPSWYDEAKIGIFIHWGVFSVPSYLSEWFWFDWKGEDKSNNHHKIDKYMKDNFKPGFTYQDFANEFTAEFFDPNEWAEIFKRSGAKYVVLTSKHHEGFTLWPSKYSYSWNSVDVGPHKDIVGALAEAINKKGGMQFGLYHSLYEWFHPLYLSDKKNNFTTSEFVDNKILPEMKELVDKYKPNILWSDGDWEANSTYWKSERFLAWLYNESPVSKSVVVNDRWGRGVMCKHGGFYTCSDRYNPGVIQAHKWENAMTLDKNTWGFNRRSNLADYLTTHELIKTLAETIACGGNLLINVGPSKDGMISPIFQDRLFALGDWLKLNGEAVYKSKPWDICQNDTSTPGIWYTTSAVSDTLYVTMLKWPKTNVLYLACPQLSKKSIITMIGVDQALPAVVTNKHMVKISLPDKAMVPGNWAWVLKITNISAP